MASVKISVTIRERSASSFICPAPFQKVHQIIGLSFDIADTGNIPGIGPLQGILPSGGQLNLSDTCPMQETPCQTAALPQYDDFMTWDLWEKITQKEK